MRKFTETFGAERPSPFEPYGKSGYIVRENIREVSYDENGEKRTRYEADSTIYTAQEYIVYLQAKLANKE